jgi:hypothetical protein
MERYVVKVMLGIFAAAMFGMSGCGSGGDSGTPATNPSLTNPAVATSPSKYYCRDGTSSTGCSNWYPLFNNNKVYFSNTNCNDNELKIMYQATGGWGNEPTPTVDSTKYHGTCVVLPEWGG